MATDFIDAAEDGVQYVCKYACVSTALRAIAGSGMDGVNDAAAETMTALSTGIDAAIGAVELALAKASAAKEWVDHQKGLTQLAYDTVRNTLDEQIQRLDNVIPTEYLVTCPQLAMVSMMLRGVIEELLAPYRELFMRIDELLRLSMAYAAIIAKWHQVLDLLNDIKNCLALFGVEQEVVSRRWRQTRQVVMG